MCPLTTTKGRQTPVLCFWGQAILKNLLGFRLEHRGAEDGARAFHLQQRHEAVAANAVQILQRQAQCRRSPFHIPTGISSRTGCEYVIVSPRFSPRVIFTVSSSFATASQTVA